MNKYFDPYLLHYRVNDMYIYIYITCWLLWYTHQFILPQNYVLLLKACIFGKCFPVTLNILLVKAYQSVLHIHNLLMSSGKNFIRFRTNMSPWQLSWISEDIFAICLEISYMAHTCKKKITNNQSFSIFPYICRIWFLLFLVIM